ncbi:MAG: M1 family aminopeptidase [Candidatus Krumholzibacteria bacterium]|nr:M1 family aminopeptidase [Candidatus Krumholzibacteria bacterium]
MTYRIRGAAVAAMLSLLFLTVSVPLAFAGDDPHQKRDSLLEHRLQEAQSKQTMAKGLLAAAAQKTANQAFYDVHHYGLELTLNSSTQNLIGTVTTTAEVVGSAISTLDLNLQSGLNVSAVTADGNAATFSRSGAILTVNLDRTYNVGETAIVGVSYNGNPAGGAFGWSSFSGLPMTWTLSEPYGAREWWPCKDLNTDKADSLDITVTVLNDQIVASQGLLQSDVDDGTWRTFHWKTNYPTATYLVSLAIYPYQQYSDWYTPLAGGDQMEVQYFVYPSHFTAVQPTYALTVPMIGTFAGAYGEYPFVNEKYGHAEFTWGGGMEHQTITSMGGYSEDLISHELAHQWWGDMVTCADFGHIWLNEGFATWSEAYWAEQTYGFATYQDYMAAAAYYGPGTIFVENPLTENIFDSNLTYNKGSWIVHMLRGVLGDADFFTGLQNYRANNLYGTATTADLQATLELVSGRDLTAFFQQWIYGEYFPIYEMSWVVGPSAGEITVTLEQVQDNAGVFTMPVPLRITTDLGTTDVKVENDQLSQSFVIAVDGSVASVEVDPDKWILRQTLTVVTNASLDQGVLLVNGVSWDTYGTEITNAYEAKAFWGDTPISFWDNFNAPVGGYPSTLPAPLGNGSVPAGIIGNYSTVIWVGNNYAGDLAKWAETPIKSYLEAGGNVLLMGRLSHSFLTGGLDTYLDVTFAESESSLGNSVAVAPGLVDNPLTGAQNLNDVFLNFVGANSTALFNDTAGFASARLTGVVTAPPAGGTFRADGGRFAQISGRPYRMDAAALSANVEYILANHLLEPYVPASPVADDPNGALPSRSVLGANYPNPFNPQTIIPFSVAQRGAIALNVYDARGHMVRHLAAGEFVPGSHSVRWDGTDDSGRSMPSGTYFVRLKDAVGQVETSGLVLVR